MNMATAARTRPGGARLTRPEAKQRTQDRLIAAAREVFLDRGFHAASVSEIADQAGYTTGAIYSNFGGKDELFLAMLDAELSERALAQRERLMEAASFEEMARGAARDLHRAGARDPAMTPLIVEFWTYAAPKPKLRKRASGLHERQIRWIADVLREGCERHGVRLRLSPEDAARGGGALSRGVRLERLLDPAGVAEKAFVEMFTAYITGLAEPEGKASS
jgi:AcrR family transcriptional regulator